MFLSLVVDFLERRIPGKKAETRPGLEVGFRGSLLWGNQKWNLLIERVLMDMALKISFVRPGGGAWGVAGV